jgi:hypothetical protein
MVGRVKPRLWIFSSSALPTQGSSLGKPRHGIATTTIQHVVACALTMVQRVSPQGIGRLFVLLLSAAGGTVHSEIVTTVDHSDIRVLVNA